MPNIHTLPPPSTSGPSLKEQIEQGLTKTEKLIPGEKEEDEKWSYKKTIPTLVLYDEQGLRLYDKITSHAPEYYLFEDELSLLKDHGDEIARAMGFPGKSDEEEERRYRENERAPEKRWRPARWGDTEVGKWNNGVNGEEGLGGGWQKGWDVVELGAGALRKTAHLLTALSSALPNPPANAASLPPPITYHPLDLSRPELNRVLEEMQTVFGPQLEGKVACIGLHGDYDAGLDLIRLITSPMASAITDDTSDSISRTWSPIEDDTPSIGSARLPSVDTSPICARPLHLVFLGSSLGNFSREAAGPFLASLPLRQGDTLLLGLDGRPAPGKEGRTKVEVAYNDPAGFTKAFEEHGWDVVRQELGLIDDAGVEFVGRYNEVLGRHEAYFKSKDKQILHLPLSDSDVILDKGELLNIEWSYKYSHLEALQLFSQSNLRVINSWKAPESEYRLWLLERPNVHFNLDMISKPDPNAVAVGKGVPSWEDWNSLWKLWDHITLDMIPSDMLHTKPIDLRHICLFYLGHIPTFLDIHLTRMTNGVHTEPEHFKYIFERGIDPDVEDPTKVHAHSEVPTAQEEWPSLDEILAFRDRVRARVHEIYTQLASGQMEYSRHIGRVLFMTFEHEAMHAETLLYMLIQSPRTRPPTAVALPQFSVLARRWTAEATPNKVVTLSGGLLQYGHDDYEADDVKYPTREGWEQHEFGWDNEHPAVSNHVKGFKIDSLPINNSDYRTFLEKKHPGGIPDDAAPVSWVEVDGQWNVRTLYGPVDFDVAGLWPVMGSQKELKEFAEAKGGRLPSEVELRWFLQSEQGPRIAGEGANVGFKNWHPIPPTNTVKDSSGRILHGHNGGVWEWTSTEFVGHEGFIPSVIYPGYSADFFDGKHFVVLGASYTTIPQIASRKSFTNWYQAIYRYSFVGARVAYDL
ncbi:hypothetical protein TREMEDRAFT_42626 [Tremella mesenterica DSM 1558]|uniref:uncharacterized protein n=1 Tax=Tremella mesenterica (strain ATCC 24925 / CBS 8224 / DSM 1558 / NBRC 9311 / NRRL Y-6157 / RJB 2259-6 / UBC 559-6) TaxID=578456 RepID=UPI0003F49FAA|nr:uncharacterized protein TREMEDRAFT_42626 [Tremella mesenterica DSM 1558]EIW71173.1 hypothetical protein TREMEDRAFT_42626 [Tremella mesenterica DSM 1558]